MPNWLLTRVLSRGFQMLPRWTAFLKKRTTSTKVLRDRMKISSSKGETDFLFFSRFFNSYVIFGFQTTIIIVAFPGEPNRWARSRLTVSTLNLSTLRNRTDTSTWHGKIPNVDHSEFSGIQTHDLCLVSDAPILPKNAVFKQWNVQ